MIKVILFQNNKSKPSLILLLLLLFLLTAACSPVSPFIYRTRVSGQVPDPTSIRIEYHTPAPTSTSVISVPPTPTENSDLPYFYGSLTVTLDDVGQTIPLQKGESFSLYLGDSYQWDVIVDPPEAASRNIKITPEKGEQGIYIARERGKAVLKAIGRPTCLQSNPPCARPDVLFQVQILIQ